MRNHETAIAFQQFAQNGDAFRAKVVPIQKVGARWPASAAYTAFFAVSGRAGICRSTIWAGGPAVQIAPVAVFCSAKANHNHLQRWRGGAEAQLGDGSRSDTYRTEQQERSGVNVQLRPCR